MEIILGVNSYKIFGYKTFVNSMDRSSKTKITSSFPSMIPFKRSYYMSTWGHFTFVLRCLVTIIV